VPGKKRSPSMNIISVMSPRIASSKKACIECRYSTSADWHRQN
jgi:hypothetical protein